MKREENSLVAIALRSSWQTAAGLTGFFLLGTYVFLPLFFGKGISRAIAEGLRPWGMLLALLFGVISVVKFLHERSAQALEWKRFEEVVAAYFRHKGFTCKTIRLGADGGIDATIYEGDKKVAVVQCKAWNSRQVGVKPVRELLGVMVQQQAGKGYFMTTSTYTQEALDFARGQPITLVTGEGMMNAIYRMSDEDQQRLLNIATEGDYTTPTCPSCGIKLVMRDSSRGTFWGCENFPRCRVRIGVRSS